MELTRRDVEILALLVRYRSATYDQLARFVDTSSGALRKRIPRLLAEGMVERIAAQQGIREVAVWVATPAGALLSATGIPAPAISQVDVTHNWWVAEIACAASASGHTIHTRAELLHDANKIAFTTGLRTGRPGVAVWPQPHLEVRSQDLDGAEGFSAAVEVHLGPTPNGYWPPRLDAYARAGHQNVRVYTSRGDVTAAALAAASLPGLPLLSVQSLVNLNRRLF